MGGAPNWQIVLVYDQYERPRCPPDRGSQDRPGYPLYLYCGRGRPGCHRGRGDESAAVRSLPQYVHTPETVAGRIRELRQATGASSVVIHYPPYYGSEKAVRSLRLFAEEVMPDLQGDEAPLQALAKP